jgi:hypothetical protein
MCSRPVNEVSFEYAWDRIIESMFSPQEIFDFPGTPSVCSEAPLEVPV